MTNKRTVLVTGATGKQGGALARLLLDRGHAVHALTRSPKSDSAAAIASAGATVVAGDFAEPASLERAMDGVDVVFAMTTPFEAGIDAETRQGKALVDAAAVAGVDHFVFTSVASADQDTGIPHFESKRAVEQHLAATTLPWTVIAPVYFMENLFFPMTLDGLRSGAYATPMPADRALQQIALADIGAFAAHVIEEREPFIGQRIDIASDELTSADSAKTLSAVLDREIRYHALPMEQIRSFSEDMAIMYAWFIATGYTVDIGALRERYPEVGWHRFADWAKTHVPGAL